MPTDSTPTGDQRPAVPALSDLALDVGRLHTRFGKQRAGADPLGAAAAFAHSAAHELRPGRQPGGPARAELTSLGRVLLVQLHQLARSEADRPISLARGLALTTVAVTLSWLSDEPVDLAPCRQQAADLDVCLDARDRLWSRPPERARPVSIDPSQVQTVVPSEQRAAVVGR